MNVNSLHRRPPRARGFTWVVRSGDTLRHLSFGLLRLAPGDSHRLLAESEEMVLVLLQGSLRLSGPGVAACQLGPRPGVFGGPASAVYLPPGQAAHVQALEEVEAAVACSPAERRPGQRPHVVTPEQVRAQRRGRPGFERDVHDIVDGRIPAQRLLVGETFNRPGQWSSYPPHKHDERIPGLEVPLEEIYYFRLDPPQGFGLQTIYSPARGVDVSYRVLDGDVTLLPFGYHPVAAAPGYRLYYLWAVAGEERTLCFHDDPAHAWLSRDGRA